MRSWMKGAVMALGLTIMGAGSVAADCAPFISGGGPDGPGFDGVLIGEQDVTVSLGGGAKYLWMTLDGSYSVSFSIGYYRINGDEIWQLDCRTYTVIG